MFSFFLLMGWLRVWQDADQFLLRLCRKIGKIIFIKILFFAGKTFYFPLI